MRKYLGLKRYQVGIIITLIAAFTFVGAATVVNNVKESYTREFEKEQILEQRRNKIDSLKIMEIENNVEDGTTKE